MLPWVIVCYTEGSYRKPKVFNTLEFYDFIRVLLNELQFECSSNVRVPLLLLNIFFFLIEK